MALAYHMLSFYKTPRWKGSDCATPFVNKEVITTNNLEKVSIPALIHLFTKINRTGKEKNKKQQKGHGILP